MSPGTRLLPASDRASFYALIASNAGHQALEEKRAATQRLQSMLADLRPVLDHPTATLLANGTWPLRMSQDQSVALLGEVFPREQVTVDGVVKPLEGDRPDAAAKAASENLWGRYVLFSIGQHSGRCAWYRDPSGSQRLYTWRCGSIVIVTDSISSELVAAIGRRPSINWERVAQLVRQTEMSASFCALNEIEIVQPGTLSTCKDGRITSMTFWSPERFCDSDGPQQAEQLPGVAAQCITHWAKGHSRVTIELSGGLDSSIVAGLLASIPTAPFIQALTIIPESPGGDERDYARSVAGKWNFGLVETRVVPAQLDYRELLDLPLSVEPAVYGLDVLADRLSSQLADTFGATRIFSGQGGDAIFFQPHALAIAADFVQAQGLKHGLFGIVSSIALANNISIWSVLRSIFRATASFEHREIPPAIAGPVGRQAWESNRLVHPWSAACQHLPPGKRLQIAMLTHCQLFNRATRTAAHSRLVHPLLSQPIVEMCLGIPTWQLVPDRRERGLARDQFSMLLPDKVHSRRGKGEASGFYNRVINAHLPELRPLLLDGVLANAGIIAPALLDAWLTTEHLLWKDDHPTIGALISLEIWARQWGGG